MEDWPEDEIIERNEEEEEEEEEEDVEEREFQEYFERMQLRREIRRYNEAMEMEREREKWRKRNWEAEEAILEGRMMSGMGGETKKEKLEGATHVSSDLNTILHVFL